MFILTLTIQEVFSLSRWLFSWYWIWFHVWFSEIPFYFLCILNVRQNMGVLLTPLIIFCRDFYLNPFRIFHQILLTFGLIMYQIWKSSYGFDLSFDNNLLIFRPSFWNSDNPILREGNFYYCMSLLGQQHIIGTWGKVVVSVSTFKFQGSFQRL